MIHEKSRQKIEEKYGPLYQVDDKSKKLVNFNEQGMARLYASENQLAYEVNEARFYRFGSTGVWKSAQNEDQISDLDLFIHECAEEWEVPQFESKRKQSTLASMVKFLKVACKQSNFFKRPDEIYFHCANGMVVWDKIKKDWELREPSPDYRSRYASELIYDPKAECPRFFEELLSPLIDEDDFDLLQRYIGQCIIGVNLTQSILLLTGSAGSGKGTLANLVEMLVGDGNYTQIRPENITGRFEKNFFLGKTLLSGKESNTTFFTCNGMRELKSLVGDDKMRAESKQSNLHQMVEGTFNVFIVGNTPPTMEFESNDDRSAWERCLRWIKCKQHKPLNRISHFDLELFQNEGSGILNWALGGAKKILVADSKELIFTPNQKKRIDFLFSAAKPLDLFLTEMVEKAPGVSITGEEIFNAFSQFVTMIGIQPWNQRKFQAEMPMAMMRRLQIPLRHDIARLNQTTGKPTNRTGYANVKFK